MIFSRLYQKLKNKGDDIFCNFPDLKTAVKSEPWKQELYIYLNEKDEQGNYKTKKLDLTGTKYTFKDGKEEIVRYNDRFVTIINTVKPYTDDVVIAFPKKHINNYKFNKSLLSLIVNRRIDNFIEEQYCGQAKKLQNYGSKYASQPAHAHYQIMVSANGWIIFPEMGWDYKRYPLLKIPPLAWRSFAKKYSTSLDEAISFLQMEKDN
ncbi:Uncharacterised protein [Candidatus Tiddalikarchaeum anstoanum]|nr:Uncharacterised protein [Candidatus Tiddalikarchaeum anstoanum]